MSNACLFLYTTDEIHSDKNNSVKKSKYCRWKNKTTVFTLTSSNVKEVAVNAPLKYLNEF